jgi:cytoskeletal protein RodZ
MPEVGSSSDFGGRLRRQREERGVSLREIATTTKLSIAQLEALERNDLSRLPGGIFLRGIVRSYAQQIGSDPESTIREFIERFPDESVVAGSPQVYESDYEAATAPRFNRVLIIAVALAIVVLALGVWSYLRFT